MTTPQPAGNRLTRHEVWGVFRTSVGRPGVQEILERVFTDEQDATDYIAAKGWTVTATARYLSIYGEDTPPEERDRGW